MSWWNRLSDKARGVYGVVPKPRDKGAGCDHSNINLRQGTAEFEWFIARGELEMGKNLEHGATHLCNLLSYDPGYPEWIDLLEEYLKAAGPNPERLIPRGEKLYYGTEAVRAYIWHRQGKLEEAVNLLWNVVHAKPDSRYMEAWCLNWIEPAGMAESLSEQLMLQLLGSALGRFPEAKLSTLSRRHQARRWAMIAERTAGARQEPGTPLMLRAGLLRKAGMFEEARANLKPFMDRKPHWHAAVALGLVFREEGKVDEAEEAFRVAMRLDPDDVSCRLEAGDMYFDREDWGRAMNWYERALKLDKKNEWARPSLLYCRYQLDRVTDDLDEVIELAKDGNRRAQDIDKRHFHGELPEPGDAMANILRKFRRMIRKDRRNAPVGDAHITISSLEAPSNYLAFQLDMEALNHDLQVSVEVERVPKPDPRKPIAPVKYPLWRYSGTRPTPALAKPSKEVAARIEYLALLPFDEARGWAAASYMAAEFGPERIEDILAAMVHPPKVPADSTALEWIPRVQLAAMQVAAQVDGEWDGSVRREALLSVLHGPQDWATEAAIRVMAWLGRENEAYCPDIHDAFQKLEDHRFDRGYCWWLKTLYTHWLTLPHLWPEERKALQRRLKELERDE
jgi:tetratricopeptide (TPR) repeat protein